MRAALLPAYMQNSDIGRMEAQIRLHAMQEHADAIKPGGLWFCILARLETYSKGFFHYSATALDIRDGYTWGSENLLQAPDINTTTLCKLIFSISDSPVLEAANALPTSET